MSSATRNIPVQRLKWYRPDSVDRGSPTFDVCSLLDARIPQLERSTEILNRFQPDVERTALGSEA